MARCPSRIANLESLEQGDDAVTVRPWKRSHFDRLAVCREKRAASPVQLLHNNDTHDGAQWHPTVRVHGVPVTVSAVAQLHVIVR